MSADGPEGRGSERRASESGEESCRPESGERRRRAREAEEARSARALPVVGQGPPTDATHPRADGLPMDRRQALKVMAIAAAGPTLASCAPGEPPTDMTLPEPTSNPKAAGTAWDPDLIAPSVPWERTLTDDELASLAALCDVILPADARSPAASEVGAHDFIDEWVSAPYEGNARDLVLVRGGLIWLDREADERFGSPGSDAALRFRDLTTEQQHAICDDICFEDRAGDGYETAARFFDRVRYLTSTAFWTTAEGMEDLQYIGNMALERWDPPPPEVLRHVGLE